MLRVEGIVVDYGESRVLSGVSLSLGRGEVVGILGRNGVGKTTLLKTLIGLLHPTSGEIFWEGRVVTRTLPEERARCGIAYVPQGREIFPELTVLENLQLGDSLHRKGWRKGKTSSLPVRRTQTGALSEKGAEEVFSLFPELRAMLSKKGGDLSGGQQQQLAIARALLCTPRLLLLDEPTEGIQPSIVEEIAESLFQLKSRGEVAILLVEQYLAFAERICDRFYVLENGQVAKKGGREIFSDENLKELLAV